MTWGSGDSDLFQYGPHTGRLTQYDFNVNGNTVTGNLGWNANGTLKTLAVTGPFDSANQQTCNATFDDLARVATFHCSPNWSQSFAYDAFGNLSQTGPGVSASSFAPACSHNPDVPRPVPGQHLPYAYRHFTLPSSEV